MVSQRQALIFELRLSLGMKTWGQVLPMQHILKSEKGQCFGQKLWSKTNLHSRARVSQTLICPQLNGGSEKHGAKFYPQFFRHPQLCVAKIQPKCDNPKMHISALEAPRHETKPSVFSLENGGGVGYEVLVWCL